MTFEIHLDVPFIIYDILQSCVCGSAAGWIKIAVEIMVKK